MRTACETCKYHEEQGYTGYYPPHPVTCKHPERDCVNFFPLRDSVCDKWEGGEDDRV